MKLKDSISKAVRKVHEITDIMGVTGGLFVLVIMVLVVAETLMRYSGHPVSWAYELPEMLLVVCVSLGLAYTTKVGGHVKVDMLRSRLKPGPLGLLDSATGAVAFAFSGVLLWQGVIITKTAIEQDWHTSTTHPILQWPFFIFLVAGLVFMFLEWSFRVTHSWRGFREGRQTEPGLGL